jgi:hypothetical protein
MEPLASPAIRAEIIRAWRESQAEDPIKRHEEGGYIVQNEDGTLAAERWSRGERSRITPPPLDDEGRYNQKVVIAAFHTHPNPPVDEEGRQWEQAPSESDRRWHKRRRLRGFVIGGTLVYEIDAAGKISVIGKREEVL